MRKMILLVACMALIPLISKSQKDSNAMKENFVFRYGLNSFYADTSQSPLLKEDRLVFRGLDFYPINMDYRIKAKFIRTPKEKPFKMLTTTDRRPDYVKFGEVYFSLMGKKFKLNIYQNIQLIKKQGFEKHLFLPFTDLTNGEETYGGGRYIDLQIPEGDFIIIDFNQCYNPYCAYNHRYSCPIPPKENNIEIEVKAGVKVFRSVTEH
jgi:uncharacterized protein